MEERIRIKEIEVKLQIEQEKSKHGTSSSSPQFDATRNIRLVPKFQETEVDKYFMHFEKVAENMKWPKEQWATLLQTVFFGKAREVYSSLSVEQCQNYEIVKERVLKAYELVPEAYRQKFRNAKKQADQTHVEFARVQEQMLDRWLTSKNVNEDFKELRQLVLIEQFKLCVHADVKTHLDEREVKDVHNAATIADDYALTHKLSSSSSSGGPNKSSQSSYYKSYRPNPNKPFYSQGARDGHTQSGSSSQGNRGPQSGSSSQGNRGPPSVKSKSGDGFKSSVVCDYCKVPGHMKSSCWKLMGKQMVMKQQSAPTGCAVSMKSQVKSQAVMKKECRA